MDALLSLVRRMISGTVAPSLLSSLIFCTTSNVKSGLGPNLTPLALALLRISFSNSAIRARCS